MMQGPSGRERHVGRLWRARAHLDRANAVPIGHHGVGHGRVGGATWIASLLGGARCQERLSRRPFRVIGWDEGGPEGRSFVVEYRNLAGVVLALVYIDIEPSEDGATTVRLRSDGVADNPLKMLFRDIGEKASRKALARLRDDA